METAVRNGVSSPDGALRPEDLGAIEVLVVQGADGPLIGLSLLPNLYSLSLDMWSDIDFREFDELQTLRALGFGNCDIRGLTPLLALPDVARLELNCCPVRDLRPLLEWDHLKKLSLEGCPIDAHSFDVVLPTLQNERGVSLFSKRTARLEWRIMNTLWEHGLEISAIRAKLYNQTRLMPAGVRQTGELVAFSEDEVNALLPEREWADAHDFLARAKEIAKARNKAQRAKERGRWRECRNAGNAAVESGDHEAALAHFQEAIGIVPEQPDGLSNAGICLEALGRTDEALAHFERALALNPLHFQAGYNRCFIVGRDDPAAGIPLWRDFSELWPDEPDGWLNYATLLLNAGDVDAARPAFVEASRVGSPEARAQLAIIGGSERPRP